jgi:hypothetical protein
MPSQPSTVEELDRLAELIRTWLAGEHAENPAIADVVEDRQADQRRWWVRMEGEQKEVFTVWITLRQRTLTFETYLLPWPETNLAETFEHLLRRAGRLNGYSLFIGDEDAVFLRAQLPNHAIDPDELDRLLGSAYEYTERIFRPAMRIGFAGKFRG